MTKFRKKPVVIEAIQWFKNGDHPLDGRADREGDLVRYYRHPRMDGQEQCKHGCGFIMHDHGWIDTVQGGHVVCPGDFIITDKRVSDQRGHGHFYPCKPDIFEQTYEMVVEECS